MAEAKATCTNCCEPMHGDYCYVCGQKDIGDRLTMKVFISQMLEALTEVDSRLWRTLRELTFNPGQVAVNYISGNRARYINPVKYLFVCFAIYFSLTVLTGLHELYVQGAVNESGQTTSQQTQEDSIEVREDNVEVKISADAIRDVLRNQLNLIVFLSIPITTFFLRWQYFRSKRNYPEVLSFMCFIVGHSYFLSIFLVFFMWALNSYNNELRNILLVVLFFFGARIFFKMSWFVALFSTLLSMFLYTFIMGLIAFGLIFINVLFS